MTHVLLVDDKADNVYYLQALLTGNGYDVSTAENGQRALTTARANIPDIIVSDLLMPGMDGYTLLRHWKADPALRNIPFIVYTATYTDEQDEKLARDLGADAFLLKPTEPDAFLRHLSDVLARTAEEGVAIGARKPIGDEQSLLKEYNETLIRKLEQRTRQLEATNQQLLKDLEERKEIEATMREQASLLDKATDAIVVRALDHRVQFWNRSAERIYGWTAEEVIGKSIIELLYDNPTDFLAATEHAVEHGEWTGEIKQRTKSGKSITVTGRWVLVRDASGKARSILAINTDITEKKKTEEQFLRAQRFESIGTLAGGIAHDLNNVLAPIMMSIEALKEVVKSEEHQEMLHIMLTSAQRGADLVKQVLSFARGVDGKRVPVNVAHLLKEIQSIARDTFPKSIEFVMIIPRDIWVAEGDPTQLHQVLMNLCVNARDAMRGGGTLRVELSNTDVDDVDTYMNPDASPGSYVRIEVRDNGEGIPPDDLDRIFEPFFTTKEVGQGTGLGLSTSLAIIKSHGGFINVCSELGKGTSFTVYLPACPGATAREPITAESAHLPRGNNEWILVVDDEDAIRSVAKKTLEKFGYCVLLARNGAEAVALYAQHQRKVAVVLTDMAMPVMDGPSAVVALRAINPNALIIASSGNASERSAIETLHGDVRYFVSKPYTAEILLTTIHRALQRSAAAV